jgi:8-oxo-dGTP diphosphatase
LKIYENQAICFRAKNLLLWVAEKKWKMIEVCCAIIVKESKMLAVQRGPESDHPWKWEFPGGKIHLHETAEQGIVREIAEELSVAIEILAKLEPVVYDYGAKQIRLIPFKVQIISGDIVLTEHISKMWFEFSEWESIDWQEADRELILKNQEIMRINF